MLSSAVVTTRRKVRADGQETQNGMYTPYLLLNKI